MAINPNRGIKVAWACSHYRLGRDDGVRVRLDAVSSCLMPIKIFAYRMLLKSPQTGTKEGFFSHVCSPPDLAEYPEDGPVPPDRPEWFRLSYVDIFVRSMTEAEDFIDAVFSDVRRLKNTLDIMDDIVPQGDGVIGDLPCLEEPAPSESSSESQESEQEYEACDTQSVRCTGTYEQGLGDGAVWVDESGGAGTPPNQSESAGQVGYSRVLVRKGVPSQWLLVQGYPCMDEIPEDAIIDGVLVEVVAACETICPEPEPDLCGDVASESCAPGPPATLHSVYLHHPEWGFSQNRAADEELGSVFDNYTYGGPADLWGYSELTVDMLQRGEFGVALAVRADETISPNQTAVDVDAVIMTVYYHRLVPAGTYCILPGSTVEVDPQPTVSIVFYSEPGDTATLVIAGDSYTVADENGIFVFDPGGPYEHLFVTIGEEITIATGGGDVRIIWEGPGSHRITVTRLPAEPDGSE